MVLNAIILDTGLKSRIIVTSSPGATITCTTPEGVILTAVESQGQWVFDDLTSLGNYTIYGILGEKTGTETVLIDKVMSVEIELNIVTYYTLNVPHVGYDPIEFYGPSASLTHVNCYSPHYRFNDVYSYWNGTYSLAESTMIGLNFDPYTIPSGYSISASKSVYINENEYLGKTDDIVKYFPINQDTILDLSCHGSYDSDNSRIKISSKISITQEHTPYDFPSLEASGFNSGALSSHWYWKVGGSSSKTTNTFTYCFPGDEIRVFAETDITINGTSYGGGSSVGFVINSGKADIVFSRTGSVLNYKYYVNVTGDVTIL